MAGQDQDDALERFLERREISGERARRLVQVALAAGKVGHDISGMLLPIRAAAAAGGERSQRAAEAALTALQASGKALQLLTLDPLSARGGSRADILETWDLIEPVARAALGGALQVVPTDVGRVLQCPRAMLAQGLFDLATFCGKAGGGVVLSFAGDAAKVRIEASVEGEQQSTPSALLHQLALVCGGACESAAESGRSFLRLDL